MLNLYKENPAMWRSDVPQSKNPLRFFLYVSRPHWKAALVAIVISMVGGALASSVAYLFKLITNAAAAIPSGGSYNAVVFWAVAYIVILGVGKLMWRIAGFSAARWATGASATARFALTSYVTLHSRSYFSDRFSGSIMNKIRHATAGVRETIDMILWEFLEVGISVIVSFILAWFVSPVIALVFIGWVALMFTINIYLGKKRVPLANYAHSLETQINGATVDLLSNVSAMQEYTRREFEIERLKSMAELRRQAHLRSWFFGEWTRALNSVLLVVFGSVLIYMAVAFAKAGAMSVGDIVLVIAIIFRIEGQLQSLGSNFNKFAETWGEISESLEEIIEPHEIPDKPGALNLRIANADIAFENMTFGFQGQPVFENLSLVIPSGQRVGLVGRSGAGKSTLIRLLMHHHDVSGGAIKIGGIDIASVTQESVRRAISIVPQEPLLFHRTIRENISYGKPDASEEEIIEAAKQAQAHEFIQRLNGKYESMVGERGVKLSGGERQRIAIARAILKSAPVLLLDEATSALDSESEVEIQKALQSLMEGKTVIAIAHRLSTLRQMDRIIVLDRGAITEEGTHEELVAKGGIYSELWAHQAGGFIQDVE
ncbi:MAG: ABC transporter ATP-binding protein [Candidatus Pacebacteria bacterium]|nr:ABC transporter ATP-binding protein [Candidatus Paceibacterota bacterium]